MDFAEVFNSFKVFLMEGALGERLKREYGLKYDNEVALAWFIYDEKGRFALKTLWDEYAKVAIKYSLPFIATTPTRRSNKDRVLKSKYNSSIIKDNVDFLKIIRKELNMSNMYIGGLMGCKGDAYNSDIKLSSTEAKEFHSWQANLFKQASVDFLFAGIMPEISETIGMAQAMEETNIPYVISFMIRKDGKLIDGTTINDAIYMIDNNTSKNPLCYMTNCIHPKVLYEALSKSFNQTDTVKSRFMGIQANTSPLSQKNLMVL